MTPEDLEDLEDLRTHMLGSAGAGSATKRYRVHHGMDFQQRQFGTLETDDAGVVVGFTRDDGAEGRLFRSEIRAGLTLGQLMGSYRNYVFTPEA
ncbi:hypothetical protein [Janibacter anophelis]|uniref:hypothetical protein n=1 Tax=Janibacter anophelis TaxID=319054 RepID=UPI000DEFC659|nr:hypothetical protein [Janibacter anophelis]